MRSLRRVLGFESLPRPAFWRKTLRGGQNGSRFDGKHAGSSKTPRVFRENAPRRGTNKCLSLPQRESGERTNVFSPPRRESGQRTFVFCPPRRENEERTFVLSFPSAKAGNDQMYYVRQDAKARNEHLYFRSPARKRGANKCIFVPQRESEERTNVFSFPSTKAGSEQIYFCRPDASRTA